MSTASETERMPARASRTRIHSGDSAAGSKPVTERSTKRSQAEGSAISAGHDSPPPDSASVAAGSRNGTPKAMAASRATPRIDRA